MSQKVFNNYILEKNIGQLRLFNYLKIKIYPYHIKELLTYNRYDIIDLLIDCTYEKFMYYFLSYITACKNRDHIAYFKNIYINYLQKPIKPVIDGITIVNGFYNSYLIKETYLKTCGSCYSLDMLEDITELVQFINPSFDLSYSNKEQYGIVFLLCRFNHIAIKFILEKFPDLQKIFLNENLLNYWLDLNKYDQFGLYYILTNYDFVIVNKLKNILNEDVYVSLDINYLIIKNTQKDIRYLLKPHNLEILNNKIEFQRCKSANSSK